MFLTLISLFPENKCINYSLCVYGISSPYLIEDSDQNEEKKSLLSAYDGTGSLVAPLNNASNPNRGMLGSSIGLTIPSRRTGNGSRTTRISINS